MTVFEVRSADEGLEGVFLSREAAESYARCLRLELGVATCVVEVKRAES